MEVWGNYELFDGDMVHGRISANPNWDARKPDFEARVHGDGFSGQRVWISYANKPRANLIGNYWCKAVPDTGAFRTLRREIQQGTAWPKLLANMRGEPKDTPPLSNEDQGIVKHLVKQHALNPSQAFAVRQVLDESCVIALTGGAGTGKSETMVACIKAVLWQQGLLVAQNPDPADLGTFNMGRKVGATEEDTQPRACVLVTAPTNAQIDMLLARVHEECSKDNVFREKVLGDHPAPSLRLRAQRATAPPSLAPFDQLKVQETLGRTPGCKATLKCALNSCRVLFATAGMVANRHKMLLGKGKEKTRFAFSFVDEASRCSIPLGLNLAAIGSQFLLYGDSGQLRPYSHVQLLASACEAEKAEVVPEAVAWPADDTFKFNGVVRDSRGVQVHWHDSHRFCTTSTLQFFFCRTRCRVSILVQQYRMTKPLATLMPALFTGGAVGHYHSSENPLPDPILNNPSRIVYLNGPTWWEELERTLGAEDLVRMFNHVEEAWANVRMDPVLLNKGGLSMEEGLLFCHFLEYAVRRGSYPAQSVAVVTTPYAQMVWLQHCVTFVGGKWQANPVNLLRTVATLERFQGLQAPVILASLVSPTPGIMHDIWRSNTLTSRAQSELHLFGRFTEWTTHPTPALGARLKPNVVPPKLFQCSRISGRNKKSSKFIYPPTKPTRTWWQNMLFASFGGPRWYAHICCPTRCHVKKTCFQKQFLLEHHWNTAATSYWNVAGTSTLQQAQSTRKGKMVTYIVV